MINTAPIVDVIEQARLLSSLEANVREWHKKLKAAQKLRAFYKDSPFAAQTIYEREKIFKKQWWQACKDYKEFKRTFLGE